MNVAGDHRGNHVNLQQFTNISVYKVEFFYRKHVVALVVEYPLALNTFENDEDNPTLTRISKGTNIQPLGTPLSDSQRLQWKKLKAPSILWVHFVAQYVGSDKDLCKYFHFDYHKETGKWVLGEVHDVMKHLAISIICNKSHEGDSFDVKPNNKLLLQRLLNDETNLKSAIHRSWNSHTSALRQWVRQCKF